MSALRVEAATVYRAPVKGAPRRFSRAAAFRDWARAIVRDARCRGGECYLGRGRPDDPSEQCDRHGGVRWSALVDRVQRILSRRT